MKFFSYDSEGDGFREHKTAEAAEAAALAALEWANRRREGRASGVGSSTPMSPWSRRLPDASHLHRPDG
jgi:hypothetical protein